MESGPNKYLSSRAFSTNLESITLPGSFGDQGCPQMGISQMHKGNCAEISPFYTWGQVYIIAKVIPPVVSGGQYRH